MGVVIKMFVSVDLGVADHTAAMQGRYDIMAKCFVFHDTVWHYVHKAKAPLSITWYSSEIKRNKL